MQHDHLKRSHNLPLCELYGIKNCDFFLVAALPTHRPIGIGRGIQLSHRTWISRGRHQEKPGAGILCMSRRFGNYSPGCAAVPSRYSRHVSGDRRGSAALARSQRPELELLVAPIFFTTESRAGILGRPSVGQVAAARSPASDRHRAGDGFRNGYSRHHERLHGIYRAHRSFSGHRTIHSS